MSSFSQYHTRSLLLSRAPSPQLVLDSASSSLLLDLDIHQDCHSVTRDAVALLGRLEGKAQDNATNAVGGRVVVRLYSEMLDILLKEARELDAETEWWADVEQSPLNVAWYLLQTLPARIYSLGNLVWHNAKAQNRDIAISVLPRLLPARNSVVHALFPYSKQLPILLAFSAEAPNSTTTPLFTYVLYYFRRLSSIFTIPFHLADHECRHKLRELQRIRDHRAKTLGILATMKGDLEVALNKSTQKSESEIREVSNGMVSVHFPSQMQMELSQFVDTLIRLLQPDTTNTVRQTEVANIPAASCQSLTQLLNHLTYVSIPNHISFHNSSLRSLPLTDTWNSSPCLSLRRPGRLTLLWPKLVFLPPIVLFSIRQIYQSRKTLLDLAEECKDTVQGFIKGWLIEPLADVLKTVRTGGDGNEVGLVVQREGVKADVESLERMTISLARDALNYTPSQLEALADRVRVGDLTEPVLRLYEEAIRRPVHGLLGLGSGGGGGYLVRSMFLQVQKAKVDIDQALLGIDKLLKSQELTFAFVGVAPALAIVYGITTYIRSAWNGGKGRGRYGGPKRRVRVWATMRRIERLLLTSQSLFQSGSLPTGSASSPTSPTSHTDLNQVPPLTTGLLLLSLSYLRTYAETHLPVSHPSNPHLRLREGFLQDVEDLEDPSLCREAKLRVVERMWRCWGDELEWRTGR